MADSTVIHRHVDADLVMDVFCSTSQERFTMQAWFPHSMHQFKDYMGDQGCQNDPDARLTDLSNACWDLAYPRLKQVQNPVRPL